MKHLCLDHHSVADFDKTPNAVWALDAVIRISPPTSLRIGGAPCVEEGTPFLCRIASTLDLPQGQLETWHRSDPVAGNIELYFRNQAALGVSNELNTYFVRIMGNQWRLYRRIAGVLVLIGSNDMVTDDESWYRDRITWWNGLDPHCDPALVVMLERRLIGEWVQQGEWLYDTQNQWEMSGANRCGPGCGQLSDVFNYIDDTKIFEPS